ncbi:MAG: Rrf2 family transcriptional regulator [Pirellulales bacterium]|nr:Rrf2 family transcriptional regulator [Pirellulales bacterium]
MKLSRTVSYALQATMQLATSNSQQPVPCSKLAAAGKMPERFLLQILRSLVTHGVLHSTRGVEGGYSLERKPEDISLLDIIEAIDGPFQAKMTWDETLPDESQVRLRRALFSVTEAARRQLEQVKLSQLIAAGGELDYLATPVEKEELMLTAIS